MGPAEGRPRERLIAEGRDKSRRWGVVEKILFHNSPALLFLNVFILLFEKKYLCVFPGSLHVHYRKLEDIKKV